jgi:hypothetical protein
MAWIRLSLLALVSFIVLCFAKSVALAFVCLVLMIAFTLGAIVLVFASRVDSGSRDAGRMLTPEELRLYREQAQAKRVAKGSQVPGPSNQPASDLDGPRPPSA